MMSAESHAETVRGKRLARRNIRTAKVKLLKVIVCSRVQASKHLLYVCHFLVDLLG